MTGVERVVAGWAGIEEWLARHAVETYGSLRPPADAAAVADAERAIGVTFPADLSASLARHDGCADGAGTLELAGSYQPMSVEQIVRRWRSTEEGLREFMTDDTMRGHYWHPEWVPFARTNSVDMLVLDCRPGGSYGAVGTHLKGGGTSFGRWASLGDLLAEVADALHRGRSLRSRHPVAFGGRLHWETVREQHPAPRSVFALAAEVGPAAAAGTTGRYPARPHPPQPEAGWVGEFGNLCLSFVAGVDEAELLRRYGAEPARAVPRDRLAAGDLAGTWTEGYRPVVRVGRAGAWAFAAEERDAQGARPEVLRRLSAGTRAVAVHYIGTATRFALYEDGTLVTGYDTLRPEQSTGSRPDLFAPTLRAAGLLPPPPDRYPDEDLPALLDVLRAELGIELDATTLLGALPSAQYHPLLPAPPTEAALPAVLEPTIAGLIRYADEPDLRSAMVAQARRLAAETGLDGYPEFSEALDRAATGERWRVDDDSPLGLRIRRIAAEARAAYALRGDYQARDLLTEAEREAWARRQRAAEAMLGVFGSPPRVAVSHLLRHRLPPDWRAEFAADLGPVRIPDGAIEDLIAEEDRARRANAVIAPLVIRPPRRRRWLHRSGGPALRPPTAIRAVPPAGHLPMPPRQLPPPPAPPGQPPQPPAPPVLPGQLPPPPLPPGQPPQPPRLRGRDRRPPAAGRLPRSRDADSADHQANPPERPDIEVTE
ncbi:DUF6461 domain-containing protein [Plantactinospora sp. CA-294935]|uniref:DUF6461 domain-containing protein n=1 Tax=Plantactinospora sp. CA-294935 TaxID=3240012 RepID=UPI003D92F237